MTSPTTETLTACPICGGSALRELAAPDHRRLAACRTCGHWFAAAYSPEALQEAYCRLYYASPADARIASWAEANSAVWEGLCRTVEKKARRVGGLLDVGAGGGGFLRCFAARHPETRLAAVESSGNAGAFLCREMGKRCHVFTALDAPELAPAEWDVITLWQTLEHVADPVAVCRRLRELLATGGCLFVTVPNRHTYRAWRQGLSEHLCFGNPTHLQFFTARSLRRLLVTAGFGRVERVLEFAGSNVRHFPGRLAQYALRLAGLSSEVRMLASG